MAEGSSAARQSCGVTWLSQTPLRSALKRGRTTHELMSMGSVVGFSRGGFWDPARAGHFMQRTIRTVHSPVLHIKMNYIRSSIDYDSNPLTFGVWEKRRRGARRRLSCARGSQSCRCLFDGLVDPDSRFAVARFRQVASSIESPPHQGATSVGTSITCRQLQVNLETVSLGAFKLIGCRELFDTVVVP